MFKRVIVAAVLAVSVTLTAGTSTAFAAAERYTLDPAHTTVAFMVDHIGFAKTLGWFTEVSGTLSFDQDTSTVSDILITVATESVNTANEARDKHVRNKDFLDVKSHPQMTFSAQSATLDASGAGTIAGELNLLGSTQPLVLDVQLNKAEKYPFGHKRFTLGVSASAELDRSAYGMTYGVANALVGDTVKLIIETEAIRDK